MTVYELIKELTNYSPNTEIVFKSSDEYTRDCDIKYRQILDELYFELT